MADKSTVELALKSEEMQRALDAAERSFVAFGDRVKSALSGAFRSISDTIAGVFNSLKSGQQAWFSTEQGGVRVKAMLKSMGDVVGYTADQLQKMNDAMVRGSHHSEDAVRAAHLALIQYKNIRSAQAVQDDDSNLTRKERRARFHSGRLPTPNIDVFKETMKQAENLAATLGISLAEAADRLGAALNDPVEGLKKLQDLGVKFTSQEQGMIRYFIATNDGLNLQALMLKKLEEKFGGAGEAMRNTFGAKAEQLNNILGEIHKKVAQLLVPTLDKYFIPAAQAAAKAIDYIVEKSKQFSGLISSYVEAGIKKAVVWLQKFVEQATIGFSYVQAAVQEFGGFWQGMWAMSKAVAADALAWVIEHLVKWYDVAKGVLLNVWDAFKGVWAKVLEGAKVVFDALAEGWKRFYKFLIDLFKEMGKSASNFYQGLKMIFSGKGFDAAFGNFGKGFNAGIDGAKKKLDGIKDDLKKGFDPNDANNFGKRLRDAAAGDRKAADALMNDFEKRFKDNIGKNMDRVHAFIDAMKKMMGMKDDVKGDAKNPRFNFEESPEDRRAMAGGFEDLVAVNRRIQQAAAKPPELSELQKQTAIMTSQLQVAADMRDAMRARAHMTGPVGRGPNDVAKDNNMLVPEGMGV